MSSKQKSALYLNFSAAEVLWRRDIVRFFRQRSRVVGALAQPVLMCFVLGSGLSGSFQGPGMDGLIARSAAETSRAADVAIFWQS